MLAEVLGGDARAEIGAMHVAFLDVWGPLVRGRASAGHQKKKRFSLTEWGSVTENMVFQYRSGVASLKKHVFSLTLSKVLMNFINT